MVTRHDALQSVSKSGSCSKSGCREEGLSEDGFFFCEGDEPEAVGQACLQTVSSGDRSSLSAWVRDDHAAIPGFPHSGCMWYSGTAAGGKKEYQDKIQICPRSADRNSRNRKRGTGCCMMKKKTI